MKAAFIKEAGPPENITYGDVETPEPTGSEVLVKVSAVSVNPIDTYIRNGANRPAERRMDVCANRGNIPR